MMSEVKRIEWTVHGQPPSKSNCYKIRSKPFASLYKTKALKQYEDDFFAQTPGRYRGLRWAEPMSVTLHCFFKSKQPDLDNAAKAVLDCIQNADVITNDNRVYELHMTKAIDKDRPRVEIIITR